MSFCHLTANLAVASKRYETLDGVRYLVVPAVIMKEGVWTGSEGPLLYRNSQLGKFPMAWDHKPIVIEHPTINGQPVSACLPEVLESRRAGMLFRTSHTDALKTEAWFREDRLMALAPSVYTAINNNQPVEVSTGLFHDTEMVAGTWTDGKHYIGEVVNIQPDHLAVLPSGKGACSIADGAGLLRNADGSELSFDDIRSQVRSLLRQRLPAPTPDPFKTSEPAQAPYVYVRDLYFKYAIYEVESPTDASIYKQGYKITKGRVVLDGEPEKVRQQTTYVTANGEILRSGGEIVLNMGSGVATLQSTTLQTGAEMPPTNNTPTTPAQIIQSATTPASANPPSPERVTRVQQLVALGGYTQDDAPFLLGLADDQFNRVFQAATKTTTPTSPAPASPAQVSSVQTVPAGPVAPAIATPAPGAVPVPSANMNLDDYLRSLPAPIANQVRRGLAADEAKKAQLVGIIMNSQNNRFTKEFLMEKSPEELEGMAALVGTPVTPVANYGGQAQVPMFLAPTANQGQSDQHARVLPIGGVLGSVKKAQ